MGHSRRPDADRMGARGARAPPREAKAYERNRASNRALRGNGFTVEGLIREASASGGRRDNLIVYGILAQEARNWLAPDAFPSFTLWPSPS
jgi:hypothetical protein